MTDKETQASAGVASVLNAELDCFFKQIINTLKKYHTTGFFDVPLCLNKGFNDFAETNKIIALGGFIDNKTHCYVVYNKDTGIVKKYHNGSEI